MTVIDADAHINEIPTAWTELEQRYPGWIRFGEVDGRPVALIEGRPYPKQSGRGCGVPIETALHPDTLEGAFDLRARLRDMDREGIDVQVLYGGLAIGVTSFTDKGFAADFARSYNDWLLGDICGESERLKGVAAVPLQDVDAAIEEVRRAHRLGAVAVTVPPAVGDAPLDDPRFLDFFEAVADLGLAVGVHNAPGMHTTLPGADLFSNYAQVHALSFPIDQMVAFVALTMGGVLDRFPTLRVAFLESGVGWVPYFVDRVAEHRAKRGELLPQMREDPREYIARGQCFFSFECEDPFVGHFIEHLGHEALVFASDYPHWDCDFPGTVAEAREHLAPFGAEVEQALLEANARRLYGL